MHFKFMHQYTACAWIWQATARSRPLINPATAEILRITSDEVKISAYCVNKGCKIGYIGQTMRPHLQPLFPCLAAFLGVWQDVDFVNILKRD